MDYAMLSRLQIESSSDQGDYRRYPSITTGSTAGVLPEQSGIWSYPKKDSNADQASFNMVNAMLCRIHQSGDLTAVAPESFAQVSTGIQIYKSQIRRHIPNSVPFYPLGMPDMTDLRSPVSLGIKSPHASLIAVWRLEGSGRIQIPAAAGNVRLVYPTDSGITVERTGNALTVAFPREYMACIAALD